jgi:hypothetical protein
VAPPWSAIVNAAIFQRTGPASRFIRAGTCEIPATASRERVEFERACSASSAKAPVLQRHLFKVDVDYCLEGLRHDRFVWKDERFGFIQARDRNKGGNAKFRTAKKVADEIAFLKAKWGKHIKFKDTTAGTTVSIDVPRRDRFARASGVYSTAVRRSQNNT